jgi:AcrR family transcriptional regulator
MTSRPSRALSRHRLYERALAIVDAEGLEALTMRRLAADVGVKAPSLYNHVTGKDDLVDGALRVMRAEVRPPSPAPENWRLLMAAIFTEYRRVLAAHPNMMPLAGRRLPGESESGSGLEYLSSQGFTVEESVEIWQSLLALTVGFSVFSSGHAGTDTRGLPTPLRDRAGQWRDETFQRALLAVMERYGNAEPSATNGEPRTGRR